MNGWWAAPFLALPLSGLVCAAYAASGKWTPARGRLFAIGVALMLIPYGAVKLIYILQNY